jgi:hypothetical protein
MRRPSILAVLTVLACLHKVEARAGDEELVADVRCVIVGMQMGKLQDVAQQFSGMTVIFYYLGRIDALSPKPNVEDLIAQEIVKMTSAVLRTEAVRCGEALTEKGNEIQKIGRDLIRRGNELSGNGLAPSE